MQADIYDFDKTVLPMDSGSTFIIFCFLHYPYLIFLLPFYFFSALLYLLHIIKLGQFKKHIFCIVRFINLEKAVNKFWDKYEKTIFDWFLKENRERTAIIISASPDFLLEEIQKRLGFEYLLCTRHDRKKGTLLYENCRGEEKVRRFHERFDGEDVKIVCVYSDSMEHDGPIFSLGERCFHVHRHGVKEEFKYAEAFN